MRPAVKFDKLMEVNALNEGDQVKLTDGSIATFVRLKQKNFVGLINDKSYNIPVNMFVEIVEKVNIELKKQTQQADYMELKKNELFYLNRKGDALLFKFDSIKNGKIIGINPITNGITRIAPELYGGKVSSL